MKEVADKGSDIPIARLYRMKSLTLFTRLFSGILPTTTRRYPSRFGSGDPKRK